MRQRTLIMVGLVVGLGLALAASAADKPLVAQGKIAHVDLKARSLTLAAGHERVTFKLEPDTTYTAFGKPSELMKLRLGEQAVVQYTMSGDTRTASEIDIVAGAPSAAPRRPAHTAAHNPHRG